MGRCILDAATSIPCVIGVVVLSFLTVFTADLSAREASHSLHKDDNTVTQEDAHNPPGPAFGTCFPLGVASGDPSNAVAQTGSVVLWTKIAEHCTGKVTVELKKDNVVVFGDNVDSEGPNKNMDPVLRTVHILAKNEKNGLQKGSYTYTFTHGSETIKGNTRIFADDDEVTLLHTSCANVNAGYFNSYGKMAQLIENDEAQAWSHSGDFIYEYGTEHKYPSYGNGANGWQWLGRNKDGLSDSWYHPRSDTKTKAQYVERYAYYLSEDESLRRLRAAGPCVLQVWDDHEVRYVHIWIIHMLLLPTYYPVADVYINLPFFLSATG
jgi:phosphodiesterase/alkaline phosphatase D-like protein